jgi:tetratricopeptide (TPR) repeat protein
MKWLNILIKYRLWIGLVLLALAIYTNLEAGFWPAFILYFLAIIAILGHFLLGPMRLIQGHMEEGDIEGAKKVLASIWFPGLLIKPVRSVYYTIKGNLAMAENNFEVAEQHLKKGNHLMSNSTLMQGQMKQAEGANKLQLGMLAMQKGDMKQAESYIRQAIRAGLPDNENNAVAYLQLCSIMMNKREFRAAKEFFRKAKGYKPTTPQIVDQIKQIEKYIGRMPG